jgi:hypothetical protein
MAYYTALINEWALLTPGTTTQKLAQINAMTVTGSVPTTLNATGNQILNCINYAEFKALTAAQQQNLLLMCACPGPLIGGSASVAFIVDGMILDYFPGAGPTVAAMTALAKGTVQPWWQANGYSAPIGLPDLAAAGGLT